MTFKIITVFFLMSLSLAAQKDKKKGKEKVDETIYTTVDTKALFNEGETALQNLIKKNAVMPASLKEGSALKCPVKLTIDETGKLTDAVIDGSASACVDCDKEAVRVSKTLAGFTPAKLKGKNVKSYLVVNVDFFKEIKEDPDASTSRKKKMVWD